MGGYGGEGERVSVVIVAWMGGCGYSDGGCGECVVVMGYGEWVVVVGCGEFVHKPSPG